MNLNRIGATDVITHHPQNPTIRQKIYCFNCSDYGYHYATSCPNPIKCPNCGAKHHQKQCRAKTPKCNHCKKGHKTGSQNCSFYPNKRTAPQKTTKQTAPNSPKPYNVTDVYAKKTSERSKTYAEVVSRKDKKSTIKFDIATKGGSHELRQFLDFIISRTLDMQINGQNMYAFLADEYLNDGF